MFLLRLRIFLEWHARAGRQLALIAPRDRAARAQLAALDVLGGVAVEHDLPRDAVNRDLAVVPLTRISDHDEIESMATDALVLLEDRLTDVSPLGKACHMALSELCANALYHGGNAATGRGRHRGPRRRNPRAPAAAVPRMARRRVRHRAGAGVRRHRDRRPAPRNGLPETLDAALTSTLHAARLDLYSARGFLVTEIVQGSKKMTPFPSPEYKKGTWISYELQSV